MYKKNRRENSVQSAITKVWKTMEQKKKTSNWHLEYQAFSYLQTTTPLVNESNRFSKEIHCSSYFADKNNENNNNNQIKKNLANQPSNNNTNLHSIYATHSLFSLWFKLFSF